MGAWGPGLYSDDYALDLRATISAVCRIPIDGSEIVRLLSDLEPVSAMPDDEDHTTFWLVVADQLHRRGIVSPAQERALAIIDDGSDLAGLHALGMGDADLARRRKNLEKLREALTQPAPEARRKTLSKPQPLLVEPGQVYGYPVDARGHCINPYFTDATRPEFDEKGWGAFVVLHAGHALGYLAWYRLARSRKPTRRKHGARKALAGIDLARVGIGTLTRLHAERMRLDLLGSVEVDGGDEPAEADTIRVAAADIGIANLLSFR